MYSLLDNLCEIAVDCRKAVYIMEAAIAQTFVGLAQKEIAKVMNDEQGQVGQVMKKLEEATGFSRENISSGMQVFVCAYLVFGHGAGLLCNVIGFAYPAYASVAAIESNCKEDDTQWLIYWTVFALFSLMDFVSDIIMSWCPLYWLGKCVFLIWLYLPFTRGALQLYKSHVRPMYFQHILGQRLQPVEQQTQPPPVENPPSAPREPSAASSESQPSESGSISGSSQEESEQ